MAKINHILFGQGKGKVGGLVLQRYEGMNIAREKPISVKNPQSTKQSEQRAKFKLSSQIVAQFKEVFSARLANLSIYERSRRSSAVNAILGAISTTNPNTPQALIASVTSAINAKSMSGISGLSMTFDDNNGTFDITATNGDRVLVVATAYDSDGTFIERKVDSYESSGEIKHIIPPAGNTYVCMAVAMRAATEAGRATISNLTATDTTFSNAIARSVASGDVQISDIVGMGGTD